MAQSAHQYRNSPRPADGGAWWRGACDGIFAAVTVVALFALTVWLAPALARALEISVTVANVSAATFRSHDGESPYPRDLDEEQPEPPIAGAPRGAGPRSA